RHHRTSPPLHGLRGRPGRLRSGSAEFTAPTGGCIAGGAVMTSSGFVAVRPGHAIPRGQIPDVRMAGFRQTILDGVARGQRVAALFAAAQSASELRLYAVLADSARSLLRICRTTLDSESFPSLTPDCPQVHLFERELAEQYGVRAEGHPWLKPVRYHAS